MRAVEHNHKQEYTVITRASFSLSQKLKAFPGCSLGKVSLNVEISTLGFHQIPIC